MLETNDDKFTAIISEKNGKTVEKVTVLLSEMVQRGELSAGDRLPPERDLAKLLGVSRPTLRAGIRSLATVGILQSKQGAGTFVAKVEESPMLEGNPLRMLAALHGFTTDEMFEARLSLEVSVAEFAAERATSEQIKQMAEEVAGMNASVHNPEQYFVHDRRFYHAVAAASANRILISLLNMVAEILSEQSGEIVKNAEDLEESAAYRNKIYRAIRERKPEAAGRSTREYLLKQQSTAAV